MNDIEAIARAMIDADCEMLDDLLKTLGPTYATIKPTWETDSERYKIRARAALQAIIARWIEPGDEAKFSGSEALNQCRDLDYRPARKPYSPTSIGAAKDCWQAMLSEKAKEVDDG